MMSSEARRLACRSVLSIAALSLLLAGGCKRYYRVTDLETGDIYYTDHIDKRNTSLSGVLHFVDESTGAVINLDDFEYRKIGRGAFRRGIGESDGQ